MNCVTDWFNFDRPDLLGVAYLNDGKERVTIDRPDLLE